MKKRLAASFCGLIVFAACGLGTDAATRLAYDVEAGVKHLGTAPGSTFTFTHTPSRDCTGPYTVQLDEVGALIIWCKDSAGKTLSSHSTSYHSRFVQTPRTFLLDKPAGSALAIHLERREGKAVIINVE